MVLYTACQDPRPHGGEHLKDLLVGQILRTIATQLLWLAGISAVLGAALHLGWVRRPGRFGFTARSRSPRGHWPHAYRWLDSH